MCAPFLPSQEIEMSPSKIICFMMLANVWAMGFVAAWRKKHSTDSPKKPQGYVQFIATYLPASLKIWFILSMLSGSVAAIILSLRSRPRPRLGGYGSRPTFQSVTKECMLRFQNRKNPHEHEIVTLLRQNLRWSGVRELGALAFGSWSFAGTITPFPLLRFLSPQAISKQLRACLKTARGPVFLRKSCMARRNEGASPQRAVTEEQRSQTAFCTETPRGGGSFGCGLRWLGRYSPLRGCSGFAALAAAKIPRRRNLSEFSNRLLAGTIQLEKSHRLGTDWW